MSRETSRMVERTLFLLLLLTFILFLLILPFITHGADSISGKFVPLEKFEGSAKLSHVYESGELSVFLNRLFLAALSLGAVLAVLRLAWAGFQYMASDLWSSKEHAKEIIRETLLGLFLLLSINLILFQINPDILKLNVEITKLPTPSSSPAGVPTGSYCYSYQEKSTLNIHSSCTTSEELCEQDRSQDPFSVSGCTER